MRARHSHVRRTQSADEDEQGGPSVMHLLQLLPLLLILLMSFLSLPSRVDPKFRSVRVSDQGVRTSPHLALHFPPPASLDRTADFRFERQTQVRGVAYFLDEAGARKARSLSWVREVEQEVETAQAQRLRQQCLNERETQRRMQYRARARGDRRLMDQANRMALQACDEYQKFVAG